MRRIAGIFVFAWALMVVTAAAATGDHVAVLDDCDPTDPAWAPIGGCTLKKGDVLRAEFDAFLPSGHPAWRNEPQYVKIRLGQDVNVNNEGGRDHTFTQVAQFGGGFVPPLNNPPGSPAVPECAEGPANPGVASSFLPPGDRLRVTGLGVGTHRFQCCIHPWMRAAIKVTPEE